MFRLIIFSCLFLAIFAASHSRGKPSEGRIVGGHDTDITDVPHQVSVQYNNKHSCGGSIIGPKHILTAAHCTEFGDDDLFSIRAGSNFHNKGGQVVNVDEIIYHPNYTSATQDYDAAVLVLKAPLTLSDRAKIAKLANVEPKVRDMVLVSGWGSRGEGQPEAELLQSVSVPVVSKTVCNEMYEYDDATTDQMFCAGLEGGKDTCDGDSGGPAVFKDKLVGIVSWGGKCGDENKPSVYTSIAKIATWISAQIQK